MKGYAASTHFELSHVNTLLLSPSLHFSPFFALLSPLYSPIFVILGTNVKGDGSL